MIKYFFITILFFSVGCNSPKKKSADIISPEKMKLVFIMILGYTSRHEMKL